MSEQSPLGSPYKDLGSRLKRARELRQKSLAEVSGAVEIDSEQLSQFENGELRPSEDILLLLISHFDLRDEDATRLWELAGYADTKNVGTPGATQTSSFDLGQPVAMVMPMDLRVIYTDMVQVSINDYGVVMNFLQGSGPNKQPLAVARVGMSKQHAQSVLQVLQQTLTQADQLPKILPSKTTKKDSTQKKREP